MQKQESQQISTLDQINSTRDNIIKTPRTEMSLGICKADSSIQNQNLSLNSGSIQFTPQSNIRKGVREGTSYNYDQQSYASSASTATSRNFQLKNKLRNQKDQIHSYKDYEEGESICFYSRGVLTDEIGEDEVFMPSTMQSQECHQSKLNWEKENRDFFHRIKDIDTGREYDVRKKEELNEVENQAPIVKINSISNWKGWWEKKKENQKEFEKACKINISQTILHIIQESPHDLLPNIDQPIQDGWTPLHFAAHYGNTAICNLYILKDAFIDTPNSLGQTPLILSCIQNKQEVASLLIESGANINAQDIYLNTPLHYCFLNGDKNLLDIILKKPHLDVNLTNNNNKYPEEETENEEIVEYYKQQLHKKEQQRNMKLRMKIVEYEEEDIQNLFSNTASFFINSNKNSVVNDNTQYELIGLLGKGSFGEVYLVKERQTQKEYALKMLRKNEIIDNGLYKYAITEKNILSMVEHPFIVKLYKAFQTKDKLFFLMENGKQGDISQHIQCEKKFSESKASFYAAEALLALEYLHSMDIIYRDLKAQNILIGEDGHIRLSDFGLSKEGVREYDRGARSFCGSVAYMPPEILRNQGHGKSLDLYLLGAFIYEMIAGQAPFGGKDEATVYNNIQMNTLKFPPFMSRTAKSLLIKLLSKDPRFRPTPEHIKRHPFFSNINWKQLELKNINPPQLKQKNQQIYQNTEDIFLEKGDMIISPNKLNNLANEIELNEQKKGVFNKWTFIANP